MDKLFRYAKVAAIITIVSAALFALLQLVWIFTGNWWSISLVLNIVEFATIAVFGSLICKFSVKGSPLRIPAMIGIISAAIGFAIGIIYGPIKYLVAFYEGNVMRSICAIGFSISFIWLSKYFNDKKIKQLCIAYPVFLCTYIIFGFTFIKELFWNREAHDIQNSYYVIDTLLATLRMITLSAFYHMFYKMSTK